MYYNVMGGEVVFHFFGGCCHTTGLRDALHLKKTPCRIRIRTTQKFILHGEPAFLKPSPLDWNRVLRDQPTGRSAKVDPPNFF